MPSAKGLFHRAVIESGATIKLVEREQAARVAAELLGKLGLGKSQVRELQNLPIDKVMIVPVVGNFGGPKAIRAVATYLKQKETPVSVFYTSNVEQYLRDDRIWGNFCASAATLPIDAKSIFLRTLRAGFSGQPTVVGANGNFNLELAPMSRDLANCGR